MEEYMSNKWLVRFAVVNVLLLSHGWITARAQTVAYSITDFGTLGGTMSTACGINDRGQVVGKSATAAGPIHTFLWEGGTMTDLGTLPQLLFSEARAINNRGQVVGDSTAAGVPPFHAALWENGTVTPLGVLPGGFASFAIGINNRAQVVGASRTANRDVHAFLWQDDTITDLGTLGGTSSVVQPPLPASCNLQPHPGAFGGAVVGAFSLANGINNRGQVVGRSIATGGADHAFIWHKGVMTDLNNSISPNSGWLLIEAAAINNAGEIVGFGLINGQTHAFLLTPTDD
jgi:probable HAF family extracellular repeat protein